MLNHETISEVREQYLSYKNQLAKTYKAYTHIKEYKHSSGQTVVATTTVKAWYDLNNQYARIQTGIVARLGYEAIDVDWLHLHEQSEAWNENIPLEDFLALPDWDDSLQNITSRIK